MKQWVRTVALACVVCLAASGVALAAVERRALLIGNAAYAGKDRLDNPVNDVEDYGQALTAAGFAVTVKKNLKRDELLTAVEQFGKQVAAMDGIALLHYAGHGVMLDKANYVVPIGARLDADPGRLADDSLLLDRLVKHLGTRPGRVNVVILDMCRNIPSRGLRGQEGGLAPMHPVSGTLLAFSTRFGHSAQDGVGQRNSPYARQLIAALGQRDLSVTDYFAEVRAGVLRETNNSQTPEELSQLLGRAPVLVAGGDPPPPPQQARPVQVPAVHQTAPAPATGLSEQEQAAVALTRQADAAKAALERQLAEEKRERKEKAKHQTLTFSQKACDGGDAAVCSSLAAKYANGNGVLRDEKRAAILFQQACDRGNAGGCFNLGWMYHNGRGVEKDERHAAALYQKACDGEIAGGCVWLGTMFINGWGVVHDDKQAATLYRKACDLGGIEGCFGSYFIRHDDRGGVKHALNLSEKACDMGNALECFKVGAMLSSAAPGTSSAENIHSVALFQKACDGGEMRGCYALGLMYASGRGVDRDDRKSVDLQRKACDGGCTSGCVSLGGDYRFAQGVGRDVKRAVTLYRKACDAGDKQGCEQLGNMYQWGWGVGKDNSQAIELYQKACDRGNPEGCDQARRLM